MNDSIQWMAQRQLNDPQLQGKQTNNVFFFKKKAESKQLELFTSSLRLRKCSWLMAFTFNCLVQTDRTRIQLESNWHQPKRREKERATIQIVLGQVKLPKWMLTQMDKCVYDAIGCSSTSTLFQWRIRVIERAAVSKNLIKRKPCAPN